MADTTTVPETNKQREIRLKNEAEKARNDKLREQLQSKQKQVEGKPQVTSEAPAVARQAPAFSEQYIADAHEYLTSKGWRCLGMREDGLSQWEDPKVNLPLNQQYHTYTLPEKEGGIQEFRQKVVPIGRWNHDMNSALQVQRGRDDAETAAKARVA